MALLLVIGLGCQTSRTCHGPSRAVTPARMVPAPRAGLFGIMLGSDADQVREQCGKVGALTRPAAGMVCQMRAEKGELGAWKVENVTVRMDPFQRARTITAEGALDPSGEQALVKSIIADISAAVHGEAAEGGLIWCASQGRCESNGDHAIWRFEGGAVWLRSRRTGLMFELELSHTHPDLEERVIYGLPVCG
jgi:hypothetical protein